MQYSLGNICALFVASSHAFYVRSHFSWGSGGFLVLQAAKKIPKFAAKWEFATHMEKGKPTLSPNSDTVEAQSATEELTTPDFCCLHSTGESLSTLTKTGSDEVQSNVLMQGTS